MDAPLKFATDHTAVFGMPIDNWILLATAAVVICALSLVTSGKV
jgi:hypothetical protein